MLWAQETLPTIKIHRINGSIRLDGILDDNEWAHAEMVSNFRMCYPTDTACSIWQSEVSMVFDQEKIYIGIRCFERREDYVSNSMKRDYEDDETDHIDIVFDPFRDGLNGFVFSVSPYNVQREGTINEGSNLSLVWDNRWSSRVKSYEDHWDAEIAIPFKALRYKPSVTAQNVWKVNFVRTKIRAFEKNSWSPVPSIYEPLSLAFAGELIWVDPPPALASNISIIPYVTGTFSADHIRTEDATLQRVEKSLKPNAGVDAKIAITPGLNLDLTLNPDFSQVEADQQLANVSRFELFYPETRQFFIENQDLFGRFGFPISRPFFSRRLGIAYDQAHERNARIPIFAGARLSGKLTNNLRIGTMNMQISEKSWDSTSVLPASNISVVCLQHKIFSRSAISAIFVDKENFTSSKIPKLPIGSAAYNRIAGLEYNLFSKDNKWEGEAYYHRSFSPLHKEQGSSLAGFINYDVRKYSVRAGLFSVDSFYTAESGFVPRTGYIGLVSGADYHYWLKKKKKIRQLQIGVALEHALNQSWQLLDYLITPNVEIEFNEQSHINIGVYNQSTYLYESFDPTGGLIHKGESELPIGRYTTHGLHAEAATGSIHDLQGSLEVNYGGYYRGRQLNVDGNISYRIKPIGSVSINYNFYHITQDHPYPSADFFLIGPRLDLAFRRDLFLTAFLQYNTQINNFNINTRIQWRFAPVSDLYLVYTNNSYAQSLLPGTRFLTQKDQALVLKAVYWLNL